MASSTLLARLPSATRTLFELVGEGPHTTDTVHAVRAELRYQLVLAAAGAITLTVLGIALLSRSRFARSATLVVAIPLAIAWSVGVAQTTETLSQRSRPYSPAELEAFAALVPPWYTIPANLAAVGVLGLLTAASIALLRGSASDYYLSNPTRGERGLYAFARRQPNGVAGL
jgi:L-asparagine transporter-like permease